MDRNVWIVATDSRRFGGQVKTALNVASAVNVVAVGDEDLVKAVSVEGVGSVLHVPVPDAVPVEALAGQVAKEVAGRGATVVICNDGPSSRIIAGAIAGAIDADVFSSVIDLVDGGDAVLIDREVADARAVERDSCPGAIVCIYTGADLDAPAEGSPQVDVFQAADVADRIVSFEEAADSGLDTATRVIGIGMGLQRQDDLGIIEELASAMDAEIACSLPMCDDMHWFPSERVVGSSHKQVSPQLYIAVGISGSMNHLSGVRDSKVVVGVNRDPEANVFKYSKYGIVGDLYEVVPALAQEIAQR